MTTSKQISSRYNKVRDIGRDQIGSHASAMAMSHLLEESLNFLVTKDRIPLESKVVGKSYVAFGTSKAPSRPVNCAYLSCSLEEAVADWNSWVESDYDFDLFEGDSIRFHSMLYLISIIPCLALDLVNRADRKRPATYFERVIGHLISMTIGLQPSEGERFKVAGEEPIMTMDHLYKTPEGTANYHLPVKMSSRERAVQVWSHQALLDRALGEGAYRGLFFLFGETKLDITKLEVTEIVVPDQWLVFQSLLSKMDRIYYLDPPVRLLELAEKHSSLFTIQPFPKFFEEFRGQREMVVAGRLF